MRFVSQRLATPTTTNNYFELAGPAGESLDGLTVLSISGEFEPGEITFAIDLSGSSIPADGFFLAGGDDMAWPGVDLVTGIDYFGSPQSFVLVEGFTGTQGDDIDTDNDGTPETTPWTSILDSVSLIDGDQDMDFQYGGGDVVGPNGNFPPAHIFRENDMAGAWMMGEFGDLSFDTPGVSNVPEPAAASLLLVGLVALIRRRK